MSFGWHLPPGVTDQMIDDAFGPDEDACEGCGCEPGSQEDCLDCEEYRAEYGEGDERDEREER